MAELTRNNSRFSSFRVFRFPASKSKPPPVPPKDPYYLNNRSLPSFSPPPSSYPASPHSPRPTNPPGPSQSTMSLASSLASSSPPFPVEPPPTPKPKREKGFFRFPRRSPKSPSHKSLSPKSALSSPSLDDDNISLPWNFQHHTHVDESLIGLPPSWSSSLGEAGFTNAEIAAIRARRAATRSPTSQYLYIDRPRSPLTGNQILAHPSPRTTSLPRKFSDSPQSYHPLLPNVQSSTSITPARKWSTESSRRACESPSTLEISPDSDAQYIEVRSNFVKNHTNQSSVSSYHSTRSRKSSLASATESLLPPVKSSPNSPLGNALPVNAPPTKVATPPRKTFHIMNGEPSPSLVSPSPVYHPAEQSTSFQQDKDKAKTSSLEPTPVSTLPNPARNPNPENDGSDAASVESIRSQASGPGEPLNQRLAALPPRLSLYGNGGDLSSWSQSLISSIPSEISTSPITSPSQFATAQPDRAPPPLSLPPKPSLASSTSYLSPSGSQTSTARPSVHRRSSSLKSIPAILFYEDDIDSLAPTTARTPLWDEIMGMVQQTSPGPYAPALTESYSPTLPVTPAHGEHRFQIDSFLKVGGSESQAAEKEQGEGEGDELLSSEGRDSNRDSNMSSVSGSTVTAATVVRKASVAKRAVANVIRPLPAKGRDGGTANDMQRVEEENVLLLPPSTESHPGTSGSSTGSSVSATGRSSNWGSPQSSQFSSESSSGSGSSSSPSQDQYSEVEVNVPLRAPITLTLLQSSPLPSKSVFGSDSAMLSGTFGVTDKDDEEYTTPQRETLLDHALPTPVTPAQRYRGWLSEVVEPLEDFIDDRTDPRDHYVDLQEIAEGESGSVFAARVTNSHKLTIPQATSMKSGGDGKVDFVAIKIVPILPSGSPKLIDLERELKLMKGVRHEHVLGMNALYVDLVDDSLWIRMELMERSLADVVGLVGQGLMVQERMMARFASDTLLALNYLQTEQIAHRDLRSDNLLLNRDGVLKLADFSNAVRVTPEKPTCSDTAGVIYWQAPEMRLGPYNPLKVDVWSLGATIWEMAQAEPPFADVDPRLIGAKWPPLTRPEIYSRAFHEFLRLCSQPAFLRPSPDDLSDTSFVRNACGRPVIIQLLSQCRTIEDRMLQEGQDDS